MRKLYYSIFVLFIYSSIVTMAQWEQLSGFPSGPITDILTANQRVYAVAWTNGLFVSSDYGDNWVQQNEGLTTTLVKCIAQVDTFLLIGTTDTSGVFRSSNKGFTWSPSNDSLLDRQIVTFVVDNTVVYLLTEGSVVYKSTDLGVTWWRFETKGLEGSIITSIAVSD
ncbi:MAG: WD40/YVTN/BNR-like repeat-containing protein, partial [Candidatus Kapaibacteriota bacterium]